MSPTISNPRLVLRRTRPVPSIEVDNDAIVGPYANGEWEPLVGSFTFDWVQAEHFSKLATIWMWLSPSVNFHHPGYSVFIAQFGLPVAFFRALESHLSSLLPGKIRLSDHVQPNRSDGWRSRIHVQDGKVWKPLDAIEWVEIQRRVARPSRTTKTA